MHHMTKITAHSETEAFSKEALHTEEVHSNPAPNVTNSWHYCTTNRKTHTQVS